MIANLPKFDIQDILKKQGNFQQFALYLSGLASQAPFVEPPMQIPPQFQSTLDQLAEVGLLKPIDPGALNMQLVKKEWNQAIWLNDTHVYRENYMSSTETEPNPRFGLYRKLPFEAVFDIDFKLLVEPDELLNEIVPLILSCFEYVYSWRIIKNEADNPVLLRVEMEQAIEGGEEGKEVWSEGSCFDDAYPVLQYNPKKSRFL